MKSIIQVTDQAQVRWKEIFTAYHKVLKRHGEYAGRLSKQQVIADTTEFLAGKYSEGHIYSVIHSMVGDGWDYDHKNDRVIPPNRKSPQPVNEPKG